LFGAHQHELLRREPAPSDYPGTVVTTWEMALRQVFEISSASADLLNLCAFLAPDQIGRRLLTDGAEYLPRRLADALSAPLRFDETIEPALRYSLMEARNGHLSMHRLVQAVTRDRLPRMHGGVRGGTSWRWLRRGQRIAPQERWAELAVRIVDSEFPEASAPTWTICAALMRMLWLPRRMPMSCMLHTWRRIVCSCGLARICGSEHSFPRRGLYWSAPYTSPNSRADPITRTPLPV